MAKILLFSGSRDSLNCPNKVPDSSGTITRSNSFPNNVHSIINPEKGFNRDNVIGALVSNLSHHIVNYQEAFGDDTCLMTELSHESTIDLERLLFEGIRQLFEMHYSTGEYEHSCISIAVHLETRQISIYYDEDDYDVGDISLSYEKGSGLTDIVISQDGQEIERIHFGEIE